jgi:hypothetical protein
MEENIGTIILFLALALIAATVVCTALLAFLNDLHIIRLKRRVDHLIWGTLGGLLVLFALITIQCNRHNNQKTPLVISNNK